MVTFWSFTLDMLINAARILFVDEAPNMTERSRSMEHEYARSEGTATADGWLAVAMARLCNEVCGPKTLELSTRFSAKLY